MLTGEHERWNRDRRESIPERLLGAGPGRAQARGKSGCGVAQTVGAQGVLRVESGEQPVRQPLVDERLDTDLLDAVGEPFVGRSPGRSLGVVDDAGGRADQDEGAHGVGAAECSVQCDPATHRVADIGGGSADVDEMVGTRPEIGVGRGGAVAVAGEIDRDRLDVGQAGPQQRLDVRPRPRGLGESVREDQPLGQDPLPVDCSAILRSTWANVWGSWAPGIAHFPSTT